MSDDNAIDIERARARKLPRRTCIDMEGVDDFELFQVYDDGVLLKGKSGLDFGIEGVPGLILTAKQLRALAEALTVVAYHLDRQ